MDKNAIKKFAIWAREELIEKVTAKAIENEIIAGHEMDEKLESINGEVLSNTRKKQRIALIKKIKNDGYDQVMEEVAYTWFNRFVAIRFMEVNGYLPSHVRVFSDENGNFNPQIMTEAIHLDIDGLDMEHVLELKTASKDDELFKYLLIVQCNALNEVLPRMFQKIEDYSEILLPDYLLREGSVVEKLVNDISENDWKDQVQIIGWLYQFYISKKKDIVFSAMKKNIKISKENIPAATQLFTPDWIVKYMVENSLGQLWKDVNPGTNISTNWKYYIDEAKQKEEVDNQLKSINENNREMSPEKIKVIDPCAGSGHVLCSFIDVLVQMYEDYGFTTREAIEFIVKNNVWGLDLDERAAQLSYFAVMMKARQYDRRFLTKGIQPNIYAICESNHISYEEIVSFCGDDVKLRQDISAVIDEMKDAKEYGSIISVSSHDWEKIYKRIDESTNGQSNIFNYSIKEKLLPIIKVAEALSQKYDVCVTNPPYMSNRGMSEKLLDYVKTHYPQAKNDMFSVFTVRCAEMTKTNAYYAMITQPSILFLSSFDELRKSITENKMLKSILHMGRGIFGIDFGSAAFVIRNTRMPKYKGTFFKLHERTFQYIEPEDIETLFINSKNDHEYKFDFSTYIAKNGFEDDGEEDSNEVSSGKAIRLCFVSTQENFLRLPGCPFAYWASDRMIETFAEKKMSDVAKPRQGMATGENNRFLRMWHEVSSEKSFFGCESREMAMNSRKKWFPYNKGGDFRKWYGNNDYVVNWENDGYEICNFRDEKGKLKSRPQNTQFYFKPSLTWSFVSSTTFGVRYSPQGALFDIGGSSVFPEEKDFYYILGFLGSKLSFEYMRLQNPTMNFQVGNVANLPIIVSEIHREEVEKLAKECVSISKEDWDSFETSWDFKKHPLICKGLIKDSWENWRRECDRRFNTMKEYETRLNEIFIDIYGLENDFTPEVDDKDVTVRKADLGREIRSLISYAVGCMFGRYSLDKEGLICASEVFDPSDYVVFKADEDNIIPICDDEYFSDDIVNRFVDFISIAFGVDYLEDNLLFISNALGGKLTPRETIREYFVNSFYKDHCDNYQRTGSGKRPIYWLFESGKKNGFKCLIYMHRYQPDTIARIRTDYLHEQQARYMTAIEEITKRIESSVGPEKVKLTKKLNVLKAQDEEAHSYEEKIHHLADQMISIDLDDGVKKNYEIFKDVLAKIR